MSRNLEEDVVVLHELVKLARGRLDDATWDYLVGATETEFVPRTSPTPLSSPSA